MNQLNRIKEVLLEQGRSGKWLASQLGFDPATISRWCTNKVQPSMEVFVKAAKVLDVDVRELINKTK